MRAGDRSVLLLFKKGATPDTDAGGAIHIAFGIARSDLTTRQPLHYPVTNPAISDFSTPQAITTERGKNNFG